MWPSLHLAQSIKNPQSLHPCAQDPARSQHGCGITAKLAGAPNQAAVSPTLPVSPQSTAWHSLPVDAIVRSRDGAVHLQCGLVVHVGQLVPLQGLVGRGPPEEGLDPERDQLQGAGWREQSRRERGQPGGPRRIGHGTARLVSLRRCHQPRLAPLAVRERANKPPGPATPVARCPRAPSPALPRPHRRSPAAVGHAEAAGAVLEVAGGAVGEQHAPLLGGGFPCAGTQTGPRFSSASPACPPPPSARPGTRDTCGLQQLQGAGVERGGRPVLPAAELLVTGPTQRTGGRRHRAGPERPRPCR